jgi:hypothetical protein
MDDEGGDQLLVDQVWVIVLADLIVKRPDVGKTPGLRDQIRNETVALISAGQRDAEQLSRYALARTIDWLNSRRQ